MIWSCNPVIATLNLKHTNFCRLSGVLPNVILKQEQRIALNCVWNPETQASNPLNVVATKSINEPPNGSALQSTQVPQQSSANFQNSWCKQIRPNKINQKLRLIPGSYPGLPVLNFVSPSSPSLLAVVILIASSLRSPRHPLKLSDRR